MKIRISLVEYLNSAPLGWAFLHGPMRERFEVVLASPAACADQLARGEVDVGLIPSIEYQRIPGLAIVPGIAVAASSAVRSVLMVRRRGSGPIRSVALDTSSRTSAALVRLLLERRHGLEPVYVAHRPDLDAMLARCDTALLIGDAALRIALDDYDVTDLAEAWIAWHGRPFVFAFWAARAPLAANAELAAAFASAMEWGLAAREAIVADYSRRLALDPAFLRDYLHRNIDYRLAAPHVEGLQTFYRLAHGAGLIERLEPLRFLPAAVELGSPAAR